MREGLFSLSVLPLVGEPYFNESHTSKSIWIAQFGLEMLKKNNDSLVSWEWGMDLGEVGEGVNIIKTHCENFSKN